MAKSSRVSIYVATSIGVFAALAVLAAADLRRHVTDTRRRAEMLQEHVHSLEPKRSTLLDVQNLVQRYGNSGDYIDQCDASECHVSISLFLWHYLYRLDVKPLRVLGIRPAIYSASVDVVNGFVSHVSFDATYRTTNGAWLSASGIDIDRFSAADRCANVGIGRHVEYAVASGPLPVPSGGSYIVAGATPEMDAHERLQIQTIALTCVTELRHCNLAEFMPFAYRERMADVKWEQGGPHQPVPEQTGCVTKDLSVGSLPPWWSSGWRRQAPR